MRALVGPTDPAAFDNPDGALIFGGVEADYDSVLDFGCGCGRLARQLLQQTAAAERYLGVDIHAGMIAWDNENLAPRARASRSSTTTSSPPGLNPGADKPLHAPAAGRDDGDISMAVAISVFTHLLEEQAVHYLHEIRRVLRDDGVLLATFFLFDKDGFPMMQDFQNALYINHVDPDQRGHLRPPVAASAAAREAGLVISPCIRPRSAASTGCSLHARRPGVVEVELPEDTARVGIRRPPLMPERAERIGLPDED